MLRNQLAEQTCIKKEYGRQSGQEKKGFGQECEIPTGVAHFKTFCPHPAADQ